MLGEGWQLPVWQSVPCLFASSYQKPRAALAALLPAGEAKPCHRILHQWPICQGTKQWLWEGLAMSLLVC